MRLKDRPLMRIKWIACLFFCLFYSVIIAQPSRFKVALPVGTNVAQIKGDPYRGYLKWGLTAGVEGLAQLDEKHQLSAGVLFQQIGGFPSETEIKRDGENYLDMRLTYIEVPFLAHFLWKEKDDNYRFDWHIGGSVARLLSSRLTGTRTVTVGGGEEPHPIFELIDRQGEFRNFSLQGITGLRYYVHPQVSLTVRHTYAFTPFFQPGETDLELNKLNNFYWSFLVAYVLE
ncbi:MAG: outer membrane beta-barrel protein [Bacteroidota bacterium]